MFDVWNYILGLDDELKKELGREKLNTLILVASYADNEGVSNITVDTIADKLNICKKVAANKIDDLLKFTYKGESIIFFSKRGYHINLRLIE